MDKAVLGNAMNYVCGYLFYTFAHWGLGAYPVEWTDCRSTVNDTLVFGAHGPCKCNPRLFKGVILSVNGEDRPPIRYTSQTVQIGVGGYTFPFGAVTWINEKLFQRRAYKRMNAVAYANSNCVKEREDMAVELSKYVEVHALGTCDANGRIKRIRQSGPWQRNFVTFMAYDYVLAAEHGVTEGYVTEKPFIASASGAIPIYWGDYNLAVRYLNPHRLLKWSNDLPSRIANMTVQEKRDIQKLVAVDEEVLKRDAQAVFEKLHTVQG